MKALRLTALALLAVGSSFADEKDGKPWPIGYSDTPLISPDS